MFETVANVLDWIGVIAFAATGAMVASRKKMDAIGFIILGTVTGVGGGSLRDLLLGLPVFWVHEPTYLVACVGVSVALFFTAHIPQARYRYLLWLDAIGLAIFAVVGAEKAMIAGAGASVAIAMGVITATFGGAIRDLLGGESPMILFREIYASAAIAAAALFTYLAAKGVPHDFAAAAGFAAGLGVRFVALRYDLSLPRYRARPDDQTGPDRHFWRT
ncbi:MAG TPA: trimeric intracellular cation channel family protein [Xanthobacteraceae bacterium]|nr:trimeric intracellular cation channel family protein [Xanthobacteraceae bacterium]